MAVAPDHWRVASYGYPSPFGGARAKESWETFLTFFAERSYRTLKRQWERGAFGRALSSNAVESWKSAFEEFGLLWVPARADDILITQAGNQLRAEAETGRVEAFNWVALSLLLRYPLRGAAGLAGGRRAKGPEHETSDLLVYWFLLAAMRELNDQLWWDELTHILAQVFRVDDASRALEAVRTLRAGQARLNNFPRVARSERGAPYNDLNQVMVHASLNWTLMENERLGSPYHQQQDRKFWLRPEQRHLVDRALALQIGPTPCDEAVELVRRMPRAPVFGSEQDYFNYLGAPVPDMPTATEPIATVVMGGELVPLLRRGRDFERMGPTEIRGPLAALCRLAREQRIILSDDQRWSYLVEDKQRRDGGVAVRVRRARQISDAAVVRRILEEAAQ